MSERLRQRVVRLKRQHAARELALASHSEPRRWALLNLYIRSAAGEDVTPWRQSLATCPPLPAGLSKARPLEEIERRQRVLALLAYEARTSAEYGALLAVAIKAKLASERQAQWMGEEGLVVE